MELFHEKIIFQARQWPLIAAYMAALMVGLLLLGMVIVYDFFVNPRMAYHAQETVLAVGWGAVIFAIPCLFCKILVVRRFCITENGVILHNGLSGQRHTIHFDTIAAAAAYPIRPQSTILCLAIVTRNQTFVPFYTGSNMAPAVALLRNKNIPVYKSRVEAEQATTVSMVAEREQPNKPLTMYLHYFIALLPLLAAGCLFAGVVLNAQWGPSQNMVLSGTVINKYDDDLPAGLGGGNVLIRSGSSEELVPVDTGFAAQLHVGDRLGVYYKKGCLGLSYGATCKKL